jgi:oligo-1,6-glucosidase
LHLANESQLLDGIEGWRKVPWSLSKLKAFNQENSFSDNPQVWPVAFIGDHDFARAVSRFGSDRPEFRNRSAKLLATMALSLRGTPLIYQGDEIGMTNFPFTDVSQYDDIGVHNLWKELLLTKKVTAADYLSNNALTSRDNSRTPMQLLHLKESWFRTVEILPMSTASSRWSLTQRPASISSLMAAC